MKKSHFDLQPGNSVIVKPGTQDPDTGGDISGWQGRVTEIVDGEDGPLVCVAWDSLTLKRLPHALIARSENEGWDWQSMYLFLTDVEPAPARDAEADVEAALD